MAPPTLSPLDLDRDYGIAVTTLRDHPGGFESDCWAADGLWFVKMWRHRLPPTRLTLLNDLAAAGLPVPTPVPTVTGELCALWRGRPYAVFPFVHGKPQADEDWQQTALALRRVHEVHGIDLPYATIDEPEIAQLRERLDHPWIKDRGQEIVDNILRLERAIERASAKNVRRVVCHRDFGGYNILINNGRVAAILDWDHAVLGPREHDVWMAAERPYGASFLTAYGARDLDLDHIEYALLARALRDMAARVLTQEDRPGVDTWGFQRIAKLEGDLDLFRPFCAQT
jgi:Ser/Thr protein kinase RdoA (MazF antagonist)